MKVTFNFSRASVAYRNVGMVSTKWLILVIKFVDNSDQQSDSYKEINLESQAHHASNQ